MKKSLLAIGALGLPLVLGGCTETYPGFWDADYDEASHRGEMMHEGESMDQGDGSSGMQGMHDMNSMHGESGMHGDRAMHNMQDMHGMNGRGQDMRPGGYDAAADRESAEAVLRAYSDAISAESIDGMEALVIADERFSVIEGGGTDVGWTNYRDHHLGPEFASERIDFHNYAYDDIEVRAGHIFAYATFTYAFEATLDGEPYNKEGRGTAVLQRTPEGWRIRHLQTS